MKLLLESLKIGDLQLKNRIIMAPLTRCRCDEGAIPSEIMIEYYRQRASAGMIISEATAISPMSIGYPDTPGIWSQEQIAAWKKITNAVHEEGGVIFLQIWHVGRMSDPIYLDGKLPEAPSAIAPDGHISLVRPKISFVTPRALEISEIQAIVEDFAQAAKNAIEAGFDGVEIHGANGYLLNQFFNVGCNQRTDIYGGSLENRTRLYLEVLDAIVEAIGPERVGLHISPQDDDHSLFQNNYATNLAEYSYLIQEVNKRKIAFVFARESAQSPNRIGHELRKIYDGVYIANEEFTPLQAEEALLKGEADAMGFGNLFISNPDLPERLRLQATLNEVEPEYYYHGVERGYIDYPFLKEA